MNGLLPVVGVLMIAMAVYTGYRIYRIFIRRPASYPTAAYIQRIRRSHPAAARLVCFGDSITQGDVGASYVRLLEKRFSPPAWVVMNAGINGDLSNNALARLDDVIAARPAAIAILIGTNDIHCGMSKENYENYVRLGKIKQPSSFADYQMNVAEMLRRLQRDTQARIALVSLPLISEDVDHEVNQRGDQYSSYLRDTASRLKLDYLPLREAQKTYLQTAAKKRGQPYENTGRLTVFAVVWSFLGMSWDKIAERYGNHLSVDNMHSNSQAAKMIAGLIEGFVQQVPSQ